MMELMRLLRGAKCGRVPPSPSLSIRTVHSGRGRCPCSQRTQEAVLLPGGPPNGPCGGAGRRPLQLPQHFLHPHPAEGEGAAVLALATCPSRT